jgi:uncharacterized membrane protein
MDEMSAFRHHTNALLLPYIVFILSFNSLISSDGVIVVTEQVDLQQDQNVDEHLKIFEVWVNTSNGMDIFNAICLATSWCQVIVSSLAIYGILGEKVNAIFPLIIWTSLCLCVWSVCIGLTLTVAFLFPKLMYDCLYVLFYLAFLNAVVFLLLTFTYSFYENQKATEKSLDEKANERSIVVVEGKHPTTILEIVSEQKFIG